MTSEIDRHIAQYESGWRDGAVRGVPANGSTCRVEGSPESIEEAIARIGMSRAGFTSERLLDFVMRFEARTGERCDSEQRVS